MSIASGISSVEEMEGTLRAALEQFRLQPTSANAEHLQDIFVAWRRQDWAIERALQLLAGAEAKSEIYINKSAINDGNFLEVHTTTFNASNDVRLTGVRLQIDWSTNIPFTLWNQGVLLLVQRIHPTVANQYQYYAYLTLKSVISNSATTYYSEIGQRFPDPPFVKQDQAVRVVIQNNSGIQIGATKAEAHISYYEI